MPMPSSTWRCHARTASVGCKPRGCAVTCTVGIATRLRRQLARSAEAQNLKLHEHTGIDPCELPLYINGYFTLPHIVFQPIPNIYSRTELDSPRKKLESRSAPSQKPREKHKRRTEQWTARLCTLQLFPATIVCARVRAVVRVCVLLGHARLCVCTRTGAHACASLSACAKIRKPICACVQIQVRFFACAFFEFLSQ